MGTILSLLRRFEKIDEAKVSEETMEEAAPFLADRQKGQMLEGLNAKGQKIGRYRSASYAKFKNAKNSIPGLGVPDLLLTGDFYRQIFVEVRSDVLVLSSTDEKTAGLEKRYGTEIFGLNKNTKAEAIREDIRPVFMKKIKAATGL